MKHLTAILCLTIAVLLGSSGVSYALPECEGNYNSNTLIKRPSRNSDGLLYFSRSMGQYNLDTYGKYLSDTISVIASVFFPDQNTSPDKIKASIKSMTP